MLLSCLQKAELHLSAMAPLCVRLEVGHPLAAQCQVMYARARVVTLAAAVDAAASAPLPHC